MTQTSIFISHATPEDNDFSGWLAAKLMLAGYDVWLDLDRLRGGEYFWATIESQIRNHSVKVIAVVSGASYQKKGVLDEWGLAETIERKNPGYLIPIRMDSLDFSELPISIHRKNVIDFSCGWHQGLKSLIKTLHDAGVPKTNRANFPQTAPWLGPEKKDAVSLTYEPEELESNWIKICSLPPSIECAKIMGPQRRISLSEENRSVPWFESGDRIYGFAKAEGLVSLFSGSVPLRSAGGIETNQFISAGRREDDGHITPREAKYRTEYLVKLAWDLTLERAGLKEHFLSGDRLVRYVPAGLVAGNKIAFRDADGRLRRKTLSGSSARYKANWHYGVSAHPSLHEPAHIELRAHIIFTDDTGTPFSPEHSHRLRRGFCRNWWNDRWRGFLRALLALLADGKESIALPVGGGRVITVAASPITFSSPVGLSDRTPLAEEDLIVDPPDESDFGEYEEGVPEEES